MLSCKYISPQYITQWPLPHINRYINIRLYTHISTDETNATGAIFKKMKQTPNEIESALQRFWALSPPLMCCPLESKVVNSPNNKVQESHDNRSGDYFDYNEKTLLEKYESGSRIDLEDLDFSDIKCPHTEIDILKGLK